MSTTPPRSTDASLIVPDTPIHTRSSTTGYLNKEYITRDRIFQALAAEMEPFFLGPMPPDEFLSTFLPSSEPSSFDLGMFDNLARTGDEAQMYPIFVAAVQKHLNSLCICVTAGKSDVAKTKYKADFSPDCTVYAKEHGKVTGVNSVISDIYIEFKHKPEDDAFLNPVTPMSQPRSNPLVRRNTRGFHTAGQIGVYAALQLDSQYRTHVFSVLIVGNYARLIRWDRSGAIVTEPIYYTTNSALLDFFTRYDQADRAVRGHDDTVRKASPDETKEACFVDDIFKGLELLVATVPRRDTPADEPRLTSYVIKPPVAQPHMPFGRATRTSIAYDIERHCVVFFKDSWRVDLEGMTKEGDIYVELNSALVPNIPRCSASGDIDGHTTHTQHYVNETWVSSSGLRVEHQFISHTHHRIILDDIGERLETFKCSKDMVQAILAALKAHEAAYWKCGILHRDISSNNILLATSKDFDGGLLIDWDLCKRIDLNRPLSGVARQVTRTGTWQFMAADIVFDPKIHHAFCHDIESAFFVLLWMSINYVESSWDEATRSSELHSIFNPPVHKGSGGLSKSHFMTAIDRLPDFQNNKNLTDLLRRFKDFLSYRYSKAPMTMSEAVETLAEFQDRLKKLEARIQNAKELLQNHKHTIDIFTNCLNCPGWPEPYKEAAKQQPIVVSNTERYHLLSSSKRSRSAALEGDTIGQPSPQKRAK